MKKAAIMNIKFEMLSSLLQLTRWQTVGILETLWLFCQHHAYDGELSKFSAVKIAAWFGWTDDPQRLIDSLVESGWVDRVDNMLVVHDWSDHAPNWVKGALKTTLQKSENRDMLSGTLSNPLSAPLSGMLLGKGKVRKGKASKSTSTTSKGALDSFEPWWVVYLRKVARKAAEKAYAKAIEDIAKTEGVDNSQAALLLLQWTKERMPALQATEERFRPHPATWLNHERYRDALVASTSSRIAERTQPETKIGDYVRKPKPGRAEE